MQKAASCILASLMLTIISFTLPVGGSAMFAMRTHRPINFADWKAGVTDEDEAAATAMASLEMLRSGFTMFIEPGSLFSTEAGAEAVRACGHESPFRPALSMGQERVLRCGTFANKHELDGSCAHRSRPVTGAIGMLSFTATETPKR